METRTLVGSPERPVTRMDYITACMNRDSSFDGVFVFGVKSTGVYCRPSCPARRPKPDKLLFFPTSEGAEKVGFRGCRRCRPKEHGLRTRHVELVQKICDYIQSDYEKKLTLTTLGRQFGVSPYHLQRTFKEVMGVSPRMYVEELRISKLKTHLRKGDPVVGALYKTGYSSQSWLYENSTVKLGMTPATYRKGGAGMRIGYLTGNSPLGRLLVAATEHGICAISLGNSDEELIAMLHREYPNAVIARSDSVRELFEGILKYFEGQLLDLPLDIQGTGFQRRVWAAIQTIPYGTTCSYSDVAKMVGRPRAVRAVANACGDNPVPLIIPCHRVIRKDGSLGGYGFGVHRKRELLARERQRLRKSEQSPSSDSSGSNDRR